MIDSQDTLDAVAKPKSCHLVSYPLLKRRQIKTAALSLIRAFVPGRLVLGTALYRSMHHPLLGGATIDQTNLVFLT